MPKHCLVALLVSLAGVACAQQAVYRATTVTTSTWGPGGVGAAWNGQPDFSQWTAWPERGSQIRLTQAGVVTEVTVFYLQVGPLAGGERVVVRAYANDGPGAPGDATATPYPAPGTLLWTSAPQKVRPGDRVLRISVPDVAFPTDVTLTAQFVGGNFANGPFDPVNASTRGGLRFHGSPQVGSLPTNAANANSPGLVWRRVFTAGGASAWACDEPPAAWPPFNPSTGYGFGFVVQTGNLAALASPYDNETNSVVPQFYLDFPYFDAFTANTYDGAGARVSVEGPNRRLTGVTLLMGGDTTLNPSGTFTFKLWAPDDASGTPDPGRPGTLLWTSPAQSVPNGLDPLVNPEFTTTIAIPDIVVPDEFCWTVEFSGLAGTAGSNAGPYVRWAPAPGNSANGIYQRTTAGQYEGPFVFLPNGWTPGGPTFQYEVNAMLDARFTATNPEAVSVPASFTINFGRLDAGSATSLAADDGDVLRVCRFVVPNLSVPPVRVVLDGSTTLASVANLRFQMRSRMASSGSFSQELELFDFVLGDYRDARTETVGTSFATRMVIAGGEVASYRGASGALRARYSIRKTGPSAVAAWCHEVDSASWVAAP
jgi:hypothetical protein